MLRRGGRIPEALAALAQAEQAFRALGGAGSPAFAALLNNRAAVLRDIGQPGDAVPLLEEALALAEQHFGDHDRRTGIVLSSLARARAETGDPQAEADLQRALAISEAGDDGEAGANRLVSAALVALELGNDAAARERLAEARRALGAEASDDWAGAVHAARVRAALAERNGTRADAREQYDLAVAQAQARGEADWATAWRVHRDYGDFLRRAREPGAAALQYRRSLALLAAQGLGSGDPAYAALAARLEAVE